MDAKEKRRVQWSDNSFREYEKFGYDMNMRSMGFAFCIRGTLNDNYHHLELKHTTQFKNQYIDIYVTQNIRKYTEKMRCKSMLLRTHYKISLLLED